MSDEIRNDGNGVSDPDRMGWLDDERVRLGDVPKSRLADFECTVDGHRVRPFRFVAVGDDVFTVTR